MTDSDSPRVAVIIPAYNAAPYIAEALDSVFVQGYENCEVIVVNDGSPDTKELERAIAPYRDRIQYIAQQNTGAAGARNAGIRATSAEFIALLDADDVQEPNYLATQLRYMREHPEMDVVYGDAIFMGGELAGRRYMEVCPSRGAITFEALVSRRCHVLIAVLARRSALVEAGLFSETVRRSEDFELWCRMAHAGYRIGYHRNVVLRYRRAGQGKSSSSIEHIKGIIQLYEKFGVDLDVGPGERAILNEKLVEYRRELLLLEAKRDFEQKRYDDAAARLRSVNASRSPRLSLITAMLRTCPVVLRLLWALRRRLYRTRSEGSSDLSGGIE